jgi:DNA-binding beta-propeller fold protein YncE
MALDYSSTPAKCAASPDGSKIYYIRPDGIYQIDAGNPSIATEPLIPGNFYGLDVNPEDGNVYVFESSFTGNGSMKIFSPSGTKLSEAMVGIGPNGAVFHL